MTIGQEAMWFLHRLAPDAPVYNVALAARITSLLSVSRLSASVASVIDRHELLGSTFTEVDGQPCRVPRSWPAVGLAGLVLREVRDANDRSLSEQLRQVSQEPFDLAGGDQPFEAFLFRRTPDDSVFLLRAHHIVADASSLFLLLRDVLHAYANGGGHPGPPLRSGIDEVITQERRYLDSAAMARDATFWQRRCTGVPAAQLTADRRVTPGRVGATYQLALPAELVGRLRSAATALGVTTFAVLVGCFQAVVHLRTGQPEFLIGTHVARRVAPAQRELVADLTNSLPLRATFSADTTVGDAVRAAGDQVVSGLAASRYPFAYMRTPAARAPVFRIAFTMLSFDQMDPPLPPPAGGGSEGAPIQFAGLRVALFDVTQQEGQYDLSVELRYSKTSVNALFRYDAGLFRRDTIADLALGYGRFLDAAVERLGGRVSDIPGQLDRPDRPDRSL